MAVKTKKCAVCKQNFVPMSTLAKACSPKCAIELTQRAKKRKLEQGKREQRRMDKVRKQALETVPELTKKAQAAFNSYIRLRNLSADDFRAQIEPRVRDRLRDNGGKLLPFNWESHRG